MQTAAVAPPVSLQWADEVRDRLIRLRRASSAALSAAPAKRTLQRVEVGEAPNLQVTNLVEWCAHFGWNLGEVLEDSPWPEALQQAALKDEGLPLREALREGLKDILEAQPVSLAELGRRATARTGRRIGGRDIGKWLDRTYERIDLFRVDAVLKALDEPEHTAASLVRATLQQLSTGRNP